MNKFFACMVAVALVGCAALSSASSLGSFGSDVKISESKDCWGIGNGLGTISCGSGVKTVNICNLLPECNPLPICKPIPICNPIPVCNPLPICSTPKNNSCDFLSNCPPVNVNCDGGKIKTIDCDKAPSHNDCGGIQLPDCGGDKHCQSVPEPTSCLGLILGIGGLVARKRRKAN